VPSVPPVATVQMPVQQLAPTAHASPGWPQNEEAWQVPPVQNAEQHCALDVHPLPRVLHAAFSAPHLPETQLWLQQSPLTVHACPSEVHAGYVQRFALQSPLQQSPATLQAEPKARQVVVPLLPPDAPLPLPPLPPPVKTSGSSDPSPIRGPLLAPLALPPLAPLLAPPLAPPLAPGVPSTVPSSEPPSGGAPLLVDPPQPAVTTLLARRAERAKATLQRVWLLLLLIGSLQAGWRFLLALQGKATRTARVQCACAHGKSRLRVC
jgi:hypothetical protein